MTSAVRAMVVSKSLGALIFGMSNGCRFFKATTSSISTATGRP